MKTNSMKYIYLLFLTLFPVVIQAQPYNPRKDRLIHVLAQELNAIRANPAAFAKSYHLAFLDSIPPRDTLILDYKLCYEAHKRAEFYAANNKLAHLFTGYRESIGYALDLYYLERVEIYEYLLDRNVPSFGHRKHLLGLNNKDTRLGIGYAFNPTIRQWSVVIITAE